MLIAKLTIGYDRGIEHNKQQDLSLNDETGVTPSKIAGRGHKTADGKIIRGIGTHFRSEADAAAVKERDQEAGRIRQAFRSRFLVTPLDGVYIMPSEGVGRDFVKGLEPRADVQVRVTEFRLETPNGLDGAELSEWSERVRRQLSSVSLGRSKEADEEGLAALETLSNCPILTKSTGTRIRELVAMVRDGRQSRVEVKRALETMAVEIEQTQIEPRRAPAMDVA